MDIARVAVNPSAPPSTSRPTPSLLRDAGLSSFGEAAESASVERAEDVGEAVKRIRTQVQSLQRNLDFSVDDSTGQVVVRVVDGDSGKVVRQIPSEDILRLAERLDEMRSLLFEAKA
ncbi:flagellar biosynthesis protein FlaG [Pseudomonas stutzeri]|uniref:Flagellin n=1 Tax=Stutzerimonas stutzeri KOS6 TaxID=1218352 RepID=A0A061JS38_STUST|nr:flagellar protein FlaG [Stutzerimonas stutzeri]EWC42527.1 flagellin [Stutzerimonas stutzeri KOS6]MBK3869822.1 flagellar biosynthesis protein FlaG [Stutzerimonas stutzeri]